jgi:hypothetical protein
MTCFILLAAAISTAASVKSHSHSVSSTSSAVSGGLTFLTFKEGTYDVQLGVYDLVKKTTQDFYTFDSDEFESGFWVESSFIANSSTSHATWVSNVQYDSNQTQGSLLEFDLTNKSLKTVNSTYCWSMFLDVRDASGATILCIADNAMDVTHSSSRGRRAVRNEPLRYQPTNGAPFVAPSLIHNQADTRDVLVFSINRLTGAEKVVGKFAVGLEEDIAITYDTKRNIIWAMLQNDATNANYLVGFDVSSGKPLPNPAPVAYDKIFYAMQVSNIK